MKKFLTVFGFTYKETIRNKGLIISTIITLIIMAGFFNMDKIMNLFKSDSVDEIMITESGNLNLINNEFIKNLDDNSYKFVTPKDSKDVENVKKELESGDSKYVALLEVSNKAEIEGKLYVNKSPGSDLQKKVTSVLNDMKVI